MIEATLLLSYVIFLIICVALDNLNYEIILKKRSIHPNIKI